MSGRRVLILRDPRRCGDLVALLHEEGAETTCIPVSRNEVLPPPAPGLEVDVESARIWLVTSVNAVLALDASVRPGPGARAYAVGDATRRALAHRYPGLTVQVPEGATSGAAVATAMIQRERPVRVYFPCAEAIREDAPRLLAGAGFDVQRHVVYRTVPNRQAAPAVDAAFTPPPDALVVAAPSSVRHLAEMVSPFRWERVVTCAWGATTASAVSEQYEKMVPFPTPPIVLRAPSPTAKSVVSTLLAHFDAAS
ncbi:uroporphyrinogen-III synthase [Micrococcales bacterium 31B]|nr:uroporphyrinogen-III synthase [Micrococcales bacterium 31B]